MKKIIVTIAAMTLLCAAFAQDPYTHRLSRAYSHDLYESKTFSYDDAGRLVSTLSQNNTGGGLTARDSLHYDANGNVSRLSVYQLMDDGSWLYANYCDYTYNELGQRLTRQNFNNFGGSFTLGGTYYYSYDANGNQHHWELDFGAFGIYQKCDREFDANNNVTLETGYESDFNGGYNVSWRIEYAYNADGYLVEKVNWYRNADTEQLEEADNTIYYRNAFNNVTSQISRLGNTVTSKHLYQYDESLLQSQVYPHANPEEDWPVFNTTYHAVAVDTFWTLDDANVLQHVCNYLFEYSAAGTGIAETSAEQHLSVYPVPARNAVTVVSPDACTLELFDLTGRKVYTAATDGKHSIDVSALPKGVYLLKAGKGGASAVSKVVVE